ncbi:MAG TPA: YjjW family glycine radical enzyme activase [Neisseriales bacterium]|nr:YjjW family glycine radical enzyme activase [Neisseriales bacterium]
MTNFKGLINRILPSSSLHGAGERCVIFLQGCNFNCLYCNSSEMISRCVGCGRCIDSCMTGALTIGDSGVEFNSQLCNDCDQCLNVCDKNSFPKALSLTVAEVMAKIMPNRDLITGISVSGGECSLQIEFMTELFAAVKKEGLSTCIETNGSRSYSDFPEFMALCDAVILDVKAFALDEHLKLTGQSNQKVLENLTFLVTKNKLYEVCSVIVPELLENEATVNQVSQIIARLNPQIRYKLIKFCAHGVRQNLLSAVAPSDEYMEKLAAIANQNGLQNVILA